MGGEAPRPPPGAAGGLRVLVNGARRAVPGGGAAGGLLELLGLDARIVVVERNLGILERESLGRVVLDDGDRLEIVHFVGGG
ncbi:MAG: sulfur carrier protein ThiS [Gammaproteobacteria bacterium]|nr:sulfur carrier protein ThiS [Gammaproteobacteria bacterium]